MTNDQIVQELKSRLNQEGKPFGVRFEVSQNARPDGEWTQFYVRHDATRQNKAATRQILSDVQEDIVKEAGREIIVIPVFELLNAA